MDDGFCCTKSKKLNVIDFHVKPFNGRWLSSYADCMHLDDPREYVSISNSSCEAMGDDGLNIHGYFYNVTQVIDEKTIVISLPATGWDEILNIGVGTILEFRGNQQPYTVHASGTVASITKTQPEMRQITFNEAITAPVGDWACVTGTAILTIRNFTVVNNRARGLLLEIRNADIRHSVFNRTSGPAVLFQPSIYCGEAPEGRNITLSENLYFENNEGIAQEKGIITSLPLPIQLVPVVSDIRIESSTFYFGNYSQGLIHSSNMNNLFLQGNYIATNNATSLISICNSRNLTAENNCVVNSMTKTDQYYTFDETNPCSDSLSDLINLPASAFNSSFPPPV